MSDPVCPLCGRPIQGHARQSLHHLVPRLKGGRDGPTVLLHAICHNEIHSVLTEAALAREFDTVAKLKRHPKPARFIRWVATKDTAFHARTRANYRMRPRNRGR